MQIVKRFLAPVFYFLFVLFILTWCLLNPLHNWDIIGYIASAKAFEERKISALHSYTFEQLRKSVSEKEYRMLAFPDRDDRDAAYRRAVSTDTTVFAEQLPFYQIRPVYTISIYLLYKIGINISFATHFISVISVFIGMVFLYLICRSLVQQLLVFAIPPLMIVFGVPEVARLATPDGLAFCAVIVCAYLFLRTHRALFLLFSPVMIGIRTDLILFILPFLALLFFFAERRRKWPIAISALVSVAIYFSILSYWPNPGWATTFYHTFVHILTHPVSIPPALTTMDYFNVIVRHTIALLTNKSFALYCVVVACSFYLSWKKTGTLSITSVINSPLQLLASVSFIYIVSHFILFPNAWDRFFAAQYLLGSLSFLSMITEITTNHLTVAQRYLR